MLGFRYYAGQVREAPMISDYTVIYKDGAGHRRNYYLKAHSIAHATVSARELLPSCTDIIRTYHDPSWSDQ